MNYYIYILEIRNRLFLLLLTWLFTIFICYFYKEIILFYVMNSTNSVKIDSVSLDYFIFTDVTEIFQIYMKLIFFISNQVILFIFFYHFLIFLSSGLYTFEYKKLYFFIRLLIISCAMSILFLNIFVMPLSWDFFLNFQGNNFKPIPFFFEAKISEYLIFYINLYYFCFVTCLLSFLFFFFASNFSKNVIQIKKLRKFFYYSFFLISTLTTPPDVFSQIFVSFILICVYEIIIFLKMLTHV